MARVLIADDHPLVITGIEAVLRGSDYEIVAKANNGEEALELVPSARPDIVMLDVRMPKKSGLDVLRILRSKGDSRPIVLLTASVADRGLIEAIRLNVNGILMKESADNLLLLCLDAVRDGGRWIERSVLERTVDLTMNEDGTKDPLSVLSPRERSISSLVGRSMRNREIADTLGMSEGSVKVVLHRIYEKLDISNRTELALISQEICED